jgi:hypothetical protein
MPITQTTTITCDDCAKPIEVGGSFIGLNILVSGETKTALPVALAFCADVCFVAWANKFELPAAPASN